MRVKDANKWLEKVQNIIHNVYSIQGKCKENPKIWEDFADKCNLNTSSADFTYIINESLAAYKNMMKERIDNAEIK